MSNLVYLLLVYSPTLLLGGGWLLGRNLPVFHHYTSAQQTPERPDAANFAIQPTWVRIAQAIILFLNALFIIYSITPFFNPALFPALGLYIVIYAVWFAVLNSLFVALWVAPIDTVRWLRQRVWLRVRRFYHITHWLGIFISMLLLWALFSGVPIEIETISFKTLWQFQVLVVGLGILALTDQLRPLPQFERFTPIAKRNQLTFTLTLMAIAWGVLFIINYYIGWYPDSGSYLVYSPTRTLSYRLFLTSLNLYESPLPTLIALQTLRVLAIFGVVYLLSRTSMYLAFFVGILYSFDAAWGINSTVILTEGITTSIMILTGVIAIWQLQRRTSVHPVMHLLAGCFFAWAFLLRSNNLPLLVLLLLSYFLLLRPRWKTIWVVAGISATIFAFGMFTKVTEDKFEILPPWSGHYVAFPLFVYQLFSPENGEASQELQYLIDQCHPEGFDPSLITIATSNNYFWNKKLTCTEVTGELTTLYSRSYVEAIRQKTVEYANRILYEWHWALGYRVSGYDVLHGIGDPRDCDGMAWCESAVMRAPNPIIDNIIKETDYQVLSIFRIPFIFISEVTLVGFLTMCGYILILSRGAVRYLALTASVMILFTTLITIVGHVFLGRYMSVLTPFHMYLAVVAAYLIIMAWRQRNKLQRDQTTLPA